MTNAMPRDSGLRDAVMREPSSAGRGAIRIDLQHIADMVAPGSRVLDIGCGDGALLAHLKDRLRLERAIGVDLEPPPHLAPGIEVFAADATRDPLPKAEVGICALTLHHLLDDQVIALIRNARRSVRKLICLDLVRHPLPLALYKIFMCPLLNEVAANDGCQSIRRAFTPEELRALVAEALIGCRARVSYWVSGVRSRQVVEITWY